MFSRRDEEGLQVPDAVARSSSHPSEINEAKSDPENTPITESKETSQVSTVIVLNDEAASILYQRNEVAAASSVQRVNEASAGDAVLSIAIEVGILATEDASENT